MGDATWALWRYRLLCELTEPDAAAWLAERVQLHPDEVRMLAAELLEAAPAIARLLDGREA